MPWQNQQNGCTPSEDRSAWASAKSDQSLHCPHEETLGLNYPLSAQRRLWSDWADAQADLSLHWAHTHFVGIVMMRLKCLYLIVHNSVNLFIFVFCRWNVSSLQFIFAFHWLVSLALIDVINFCSDLFSWKYIPHEYRENKLLTKLNRFTVCHRRQYFHVSNFISLKVYILSLSWYVFFF